MRFLNSTPLPYQRQRLGRIPEKTTPLVWRRKSIPKRPEGPCWLEGPAETSAVPRACAPENSGKGQQGPQGNKGHREKGADTGFSVFLVSGVPDAPVLLFLPLLGACRKTSERAHMLRYKR